MRAALNKINALPIKWRLTVWASLWMCIFFLFYNSIQYLVLDRWTLMQEEKAIKQSMEEIKRYYANNASEELAESHYFLSTVNQNNQSIRVLDQSGKVMLEVRDGLEESFIIPKPVDRSVLKSISHNDDHFLVLRSPIETDSFQGTIEIIQDLEDLENLNQVLLMVVMLGGLGGIAFSTFGGVLLARQFVKPIAQLSETIRKTKHNGLSERVEFIDNKDELSKLSAMFNEMMDRLEMSFQQQNQFVEDASHELRTPIAIIEGHLKLLARWGKDDPSVLKESLATAIEELARLKNLTQDLLASTEAETTRIENEATNLDEILTKVIDDFSIIHPDCIFEVNHTSIMELNLAISANHLKQILMIVIDNAIKYGGNQKSIRILGKSLVNNSVQLEIIDSGVGIPKEQIYHVFDRFYRVDKARGSKVGGSGLGLAIAKRLVESYDGMIDLTSIEEKGTTVTIILKRSSSMII